MRIPLSFNDIRLSQFIQLHELEKKEYVTELDKSIEKLSILSGKSVEYLENLELKKLQKYLAKISYVNSPPKNFRVVKRFWCKGMFLYPTLSLEDMKTNQLVDFLSISKKAEGDNISVAHKLLAIMFKPYSFKGRKYTPDNHGKLSEKLLSAKVGDCLGLLFFYMDLWKKCEPVMIRCFKNSQQVIQNMIQEIETDKQFQDFLKTGDGNITSTYAQKVTA